MVYRDEAERTEMQKVYSRLEKKEKWSAKSWADEGRLTVQSGADQRQLRLHG